MEASPGSKRLDISRCTVSAMTGRVRAYALSLMATACVALVGCSGWKGESDETSADGL